MNAGILTRLHVTLTHWVSQYVKVLTLVVTVLLAVAIQASVAARAAVAEEAEDITEGTRIIGTEESPAVLNIVPWQDRELGGNPATGNRQFRSVLDDALKPVDRGELQRETDYFNLLHDHREKQQKIDNTKQ